VIIYTQSVAAENLYFRFYLQHIPQNFFSQEIVCQPSIGYLTSDFDW
jgi:hypothetical protein